MPMASGVPSPSAEVSQATHSDFENVTYAVSQVPSPGDLNVFSSGGPSMFITVQPRSKWRYRYESEKGSHGPLAGCTSIPSKKTFPTVKVVNFPDNLEMHVQASLWTVDKANLHVHKLYGPSCSDDGTCTVKMNKDGTAVFQDMTILFVAKKDVPKILFQRMLKEENHNKGEKEIKKLAEEKAKRMDLNAVRICFNAIGFTFDQTECVPVCSPVFSESVCNLRSTKAGDLKICRISRFTGAASGGDEIFLLCCKVDKKDIQIRFYEPNSSWEDFAVFTEADVHQQCAIVFRTPPYQCRDITDEVKVLFQLQRSNGEASESKEFTYIPCYPDDEKIGKKRKKNCMYQEFGGSGGSINRNIGAESLDPVLQSQNSPLLQSQNSPMSCESVRETSHGSLCSIEGFSDEEINVNLISLEELNLFEKIFDPYVFECSNLRDNLISDRDPLVSQVNVPRWNFKTDAVVPQAKLPKNVEKKPLVEKDMSVKPEEIEEAFGQMFISEKSVLCSENNALRNSGTDEEKDTVEKGTAKNGQNTSTAPLKMEEFQPVPISDKLLRRIWCTLAIAVIKGSPFYFLRYLPQVIRFSDEERNTLLHVAVSQHQLRADIIVSLLTTAEEMHIPLVNSANGDHKTPLHIAIKAKNPSIVRLLLRYGADPTVVDKQGLSSYHLAICAKSVECLSELVQKMNYKSPPKTLHLDSTDYHGLAPLHYAVEAELVECITLLCLNGTDVNVKSGKDGRSPLHYAARQDWKVARILLSKKCTDVDAQDYAGNTPLHLACSENNSNVVRVLIAHGADPYICNYESDEYTAFHFAEGNQEILDILLDSCNHEKPELKLQASSSASHTSIVHPQNTIAEGSDMDLPSKYASEFTVASQGDSGYLSSKLSVLSEDVVQKLSKLLDPPSDLWRKLMMVTGVDEDVESSIHKLTSRPTKAILTSFLNNGGTLETLITALEIAELYEAKDIVIQNIGD